MVPLMGTEDEPDRIARLIRRVATGDPSAPLPEGFPAERLATECTTVLDAMERDATSHEAHVLVMLLGRSVERMGLSPLHVSRMGSALHEALGAPEAPQIMDLNALLFEGYSRSREETLEGAFQERLVATQPMFRWAPGCFAWLLAGPLHADGIASCGERFARMLWRAKGRAAVVDPSGLPSPDPDEVQALIGALDLARTAGCPVFLPRPPEGWPPDTLLRAPRLDLHICPDRSEAFRAAERHAGLRRLRWPPRLGKR